MDVLLKNKYFREDILVYTWDDMSWCYDWVYTETIKKRLTKNIYNNALYNACLCGNLHIVKFALMNNRQLNEYHVRLSIKYENNLPFIKYIFEQYQMKNKPTQQNMKSLCNFLLYKVVFNSVKLEAFDYLLQIICENKYKIEDDFFKRCINYHPSSNNGYNIYGFRIILTLLKWHHLFFDRIEQFLDSINHEHCTFPFIQYVINNNIKINYDKFIYNEEITVIDILQTLGENNEYTKLLTKYCYYTLIDEYDLVSVMYLVKNNYTCSPEDMEFILQTVISKFNYHRIWYNCNTFSKETIFRYLFIQWYSSININNLIEYILRFCYKEHMDILYFIGEYVDLKKYSTQIFESLIPWSSINDITDVMKFCFEPPHITKIHIDNIYRGRRWDVLKYIAIHGYIPFYLYLYLLPKTCKYFIDRRHF